MLANSKDAPSTINASGVAADAISEITLSAISGNLIPKTANKIPATEPIISGFVTMPLSIFVIFILS